MIQPYTFNTEQGQLLISTHNTLKISEKNSSWTFGLRANFHKYSISEVDPESFNTVFFTDYFYQNNYSYILLYPYLSYDIVLSKRATLKAGIATTYIFDEKTRDRVSFFRDVPEPYFSFDYKTGSKSGFGLEYRRSRSRDNFENYLFDYYNPFYDIRGHNLQLKYYLNSKDFQFSAVLFAHHFDGFNNYSFEFAQGDLLHLHDFNGELGGFYSKRLRYLPFFNNTATARSYGGESYLLKRFNWNQNSLTLMGNATIYNSEYNLADFDDVYYDSRFNFGHVLNSMITYEKEKQSADNIRRILISLGWHQRGGLRFPRLRPEENVIKFDRYPDDIYEIELPLT